MVITSVLYINVNQENYPIKRDYFRALLKKNYSHQKEPLKLLGDKRILVFYKPAHEGLSLIKAEGESDLIWRLLADMRSVG